MSIRVRDVLMGRLNDLRHEPSDKRIRGQLGGRTVVDSTAALLVWEPKRVVPSYGVPVADIDAELIAEGAAEPAEATEGVPAMGAPQLLGRPVYDPSVPFAVHTAEGVAATIRCDGVDHPGAAFLPSDPDLGDIAILDFGAFDAWLEEDEPNVSHPRDPFHRIDIVDSTRTVRVELDGRVLAESSRARFLFEPPLPVRFYLPREDVSAQLTPTDTVTFCAYKGQASYWSVAGDDDLAWTYEQPLREAAEIRGRVAFFNERADIFVDDTALERPITPWSRP